MKVKYDYRTITTQHLKQPTIDKLFHVRVITKQSKYSSLLGVVTDNNM